jgi:hypothetical protein
MRCTRRPRGRCRGRARLRAREAEVAAVETENEERMREAVAARAEMTDDKEQTWGPGKNRAGISGSALAVTGR